jgi:hypothetical protein
MTDAMFARHCRQHLAVVAGFALATLVQTWPLAARLSRTLPNDLGDPILNTWILWWNAHTLPLTQAWWDAPMFYPARGALAFSETLLGLSILASPLQWLGASPVAAHNVLFLLSFPLSAFTAYLLAWSLTRRAGPSIVAGAIDSYAAFRWQHLGHLQILWSWWMPLALLGLHRWMTDRRKSGLLLFGGLVAIVLADCWPRPIGLPPLPPVLDPRVLTPAAAVIELPFGGGQELPALYRSMFHERPLVNGYSGYFPVFSQVLSDCLAREQAGLQVDCLMPARLAAGSLDVVIDRQADPLGVWQRIVPQSPDAQPRFQNHQFTVIHFPALSDTAREGAPSPIDLRPSR